VQAGTPNADESDWRLRFHPQVLRDIGEYGLQNRDFRPTLLALNIELRSNPKQFPKKSGRLKNARAAPLRYRGRHSWRAVFVLDECAREVFVLSLGPHDHAYEAAVRRVNMQVVR
jgi:hypothetical protein